MFLVATMSKLLKVSNLTLLVCDRLLILLLLLLLACHASTCMHVCMPRVLSYQGPAATAAVTANNLNSINIVLTGPPSTLPRIKRFAATYTLFWIG